MMISSLWLFLQEEPYGLSHNLQSPLIALRLFSTREDYKPRKSNYIGSLGVLSKSDSDIKNRLPRNRLVAYSVNSLTGILTGITTRAQLFYCA